MCLCVCKKCLGFCEPVKNPRPNNPRREYAVKKELSDCCTDFFWKIRLESESVEYDLFKMNSEFIESIILLYNNNYRHYEEIMEKSFKFIEVVSEIRRFSKIYEERKKQ